MPLTASEAAHLANDVYAVEGDDGNSVQPPPTAGFTPQRWDHEAASGFTGAIYTRSGGSGEIVLAFAGTNPSSGSDLYADLEIVANQLPGQAAAAARLTMVARSISGGRELILVGHSLGGGLAQVMATQSDVRAVTFNAPPMGAHVEGFRSFAGMEPADEGALNASIINFRSALDPVSVGLQALDVVKRVGTAVLGMPLIDQRWSRHLGSVHTLGVRAGLHGMQSMVQYIDRQGWAQRSPWDPNVRFN